MTSGEQHLPWLATGFLMAHLQLLAKLSFLSCMAPAVGPRTYDKGQCSSFGQMSAPITWIWDLFVLPWAWERIQLSLEYSPCLYIVMTKLMTTREVLVYQRVLCHENKIPENLMPCEANYSKKTEEAVIKHAVNLCFSLPLASKKVPALGILHNSLYCELTQNSNYWFRYWLEVGGGGH